ncbi:MAG: MerR family DNA-binding transcriptional regulator [Cypionkella sp.]
MNFPIGELSKRTGVKVPTIRFYEQIDLNDLNDDGVTSGYASVSFTYS